MNQRGKLTFDLTVNPEGRVIHLKFKQQNSSFIPDDLNTIKQMIESKCVFERSKSSMHEQVTKTFVFELLSGNCT